MIGKGTNVRWEDETMKSSQWRQTVKMDSYLLIFNLKY